ncbi:MAG: hypothetical protein A2014_11585 [Spirochaetes bacterium GWF1_49_6]|nr:MAG: hypothetical protein A2014_11585 [Spirochaetes bacterium GWF1_49_6]
MAISRDEVIKILEESSLCTVVTIAKHRLASRTMTFAYSNGVIFLLTANSTNKLNDFKYSPKGLLHICNVSLEDVNSYDISIPGFFELIQEGAGLFKEGYEALVKKNPQVMGIYQSDMKNDYSLIKFSFKEIQSWTLLQAVSGEQKTIIMNN